MPEETIIVWDLETVPDLHAAARMLGMEGAPDEEIRVALGSGFPKDPLHKIACIGAVVAVRKSGGWHVRARNISMSGFEGAADERSHHRLSQ
jgi:3'-5' exonuclease